MNDDVRFEQDLGAALEDLAPARAPERLRREVLRSIDPVQPRPRWLTFIKEPPMRLSQRVAVGSPPARLAYLTILTVLTVTIAASGVVIGASFGKIVTALVDGIVMPIVGVAMGGVSVSDWKYVLKPETVDAAGKKVSEVAVQYGMFIQTLIDFLIIAFVIFLLLRAYNRVRRPAVDAPAVPPEDVLLLREIRDALRRP